MSKQLTKRQREVLAFLKDCMHKNGIIPTSREIQEHFGFASQTAAMDHLRALERKGVIRRLPGKARAVMLEDAAHLRRDSVPDNVVEIPFYGEIAAGMPVDTTATTDEHIGLDPQLYDRRSGASDLFALRVHGDSMVNAHIVAGDIVVLRPGVPKHGDIVAALIDGETTLKRYLLRDGQPYLKAENDAYPELIPATELVIQGILVSLMRGRANTR